MEVKNHVILFLDILGYKNLIQKCDNRNIENSYLHKIHDLMANLSIYIEKRNADVDKKNGKYNLRLSRFKSFIFSDNILFFAPYENETDMHNLYMNLLYGLSEFLVQYTKEDIFFRGAITKGNLYYDDTLHFIFGSGLVKAYELESEMAIYPRVIIDDNLNPSPILVGLAQDKEQKWYFDYLSLGYNLICDCRKDGEYFEYFLACLKEQGDAISNALKKYHDNERILIKYQWLADYHNNFCNKQGFTEMLAKL